MVLGMPCCRGVPRRLTQCSVVYSNVRHGQRPHRGIGMEPKASDENGEVRTLCKEGGCIKYLKCPSLDLLAFKFPVPFDPRETAFVVVEDR